MVEHLEANREIVRVGRDFRHKVLMVLWILATPDTFRSVALRFVVHPGEVHRYYTKITGGLCDLGARYIYWPDAHERTRISAALEEVSGLQGVVGMLDGKHMVMTAPGEEPAAFRDRHHGYSIKAMAVCDHELKVRDLYVGEAGSLHDARAFRRSPLYQSVMFDETFMAEGEYMIGDSAFPILDRLVVPFINNGHLTPRQVQFNRALSRIRVRIEHTFGRLTNIWRRSRNIFVYNMDYMVDHTCASFVLHNFRLYHGCYWRRSPRSRRRNRFRIWNEDDIQDEVGDIPDPFEEQNAAAVVNQR
ncbi:hypothetical protein FOCC_FOCC015743 [Frankliniella occidentalis]|nr:hypothetical protein FOCC_FOCC015743 [Frankliniella occidentalis]